MLKFYFLVIPNTHTHSGTYIHTYIHLYTNTDIDAYLHLFAYSLSFNAWAFLVSTSFSTANSSANIQMHPELVTWKGVKQSEESNHKDTINVYVDMTKDVSEVI